MINIQGIKAKISEKGVVKGTANNKIVYEKLENIEELIDDINNEVVEGSAVDKLNYLSDTKEQFKEAIKNKGAEVEDTDTFRNYAERIDEIPQDKFLDVGGKNPVLIKDFVEVIPFSETDFPNITPSTNFQRFYAGHTAFEENIDIDNFDYVTKFNARIDFVYKQEMPASSSYIKRVTKSIINDSFRIDDESGTYTLRENYSIFNSLYAMSHKANTPQMQIGANAATGIDISNIFPQFISNNTKLRVSVPPLRMTIQQNNMTADAYQQVDADKTKIVFAVELYQVDKGTTPCGIARQDMVDWVLGGN